MWDAVEVVSFVWTVMILMYAVIAVAFIIGRRSSLINRREKQKPRRSGASL
jgi:hypothetical protein